MLLYVTLAALAAAALAAPAAAPQCSSPNYDGKYECVDEPPAVIIDTDPGCDDVLALLWALSAQKAGALRILAITTAPGNSNAEATYVAATGTLALVALPKTALLAIPVGRGADGDGDDGTAEEFHGADGIGGQSSLFPSTLLDAQPFETAPSSAELLVRTLRSENSQTVTILALGPLTNLAAAEELSPGILARAKEIVVMGGAFNVAGNISPHAEFNIFFDPEAASKVLAASNGRVTLFPLDVTSTITFNAAHLERLTNTGGSLVMELIDGIWNWNSRMSLKFRQTRGIAATVMHDSACIAYFLYPQLFLLRRARVAVELLGGTRGTTTTDRRFQLKASQENAMIATTVDAEMAMVLFVEDMKTLLSDA